MRVAIDDSGLYCCTCAYLSTHTVYQYKTVVVVFNYFGGIWPYWKMDTGKHNFHETLFFCFKLSKKIEKLSNEQPMNAITKCTLAGLVQYAKKSEVRFEVVRAYLAQHCFFLPMPHVAIGIQNAAGTSEKKQKTPACIREIQAHNL